MLLDDQDMDLLVAVVELFEKHNLIDVKSYEGKWIFDARFGERQHYRTKPQASAAEALMAALTGRSLMVDKEAGKRALQDVLHTGMVKREDVEWALSRFDAKGEFQK